MSIIRGNVELKIQPILWLAIASIFYVITSCVDPVEGCIDVRSSNFDVDADADCCQIEEECCCEYPDLTLNFFYKLRAADSLSSTTTNFRLDTYYPLDGTADSIRIDTFNLLVSNLHPANSVLREMVSVIEVVNTSSTSAQGLTVEESFEDNMALVDFEQFRYTLGTYQNDLAYDEVSLNLGLSSALSEINPDDVVEDHSLTDEYLFLYNESTSRYQSVRIVCTIKRADNQIDIAQNFDLNTPILRPFMAPIAIDKGSELAILMRINVLDVFKGIIFDIPNEDIGLIINENLIGSISILE